jgi:WD40 repeat protein
LSAIGSVNSLAVSRDGGRLFSAGRDGAIRRWDTKTYALLMPVIHNGLYDWAVVDYRANRVVQCGPEAWRNLAWLASDAEGRITRYPVEIEGALPIKEC